MHTYYGCDEVPKGWDKYFETCNAIELDIEHEKAPNIQTLNRWRVQSPKGFAFILHVPESVQNGLIESGQQGLTTLTKEAKKDWETTLERAAALAAKAICVRTPFDFGPNENNKALMSTLAADAKANKRTLIWEPQGMWPQEQTYEFCRDNKMMFAIDPFLWAREEYQRVNASDVCFILTERASTRRKFDQYDMEDMLDDLSSVQRLFILCRGRFKWDHIRELRYTLEYADDY